jgi:phosphatidylinositol alpha-mannosyltransferase
MFSRRPLRICQVSAAYYPYPSGVTELVHHLSEALRARGHEVHILTTSYHDDGPPTRYVTRVGRAVFLPMNKSYATVPFDLDMTGKVKRFLRSHEFDIVHVNGFFPPDISYYALQHSRSVNVASFLTVGFRDYGPAAWLWKLMSSGLNRRMHGRIALTQGALEYIRPFFPGEFRVIPPGVDTVRFHPKGNPKLEVLNSKSGLGFRSSDLRLPVSGDPRPLTPTILFVGRLDKRKGLDVLLRAFPRVRQDFPDARLTIVGKGPTEMESRLLAQKLGIADHVDFKGFATADGLPSYYAGADVYCSPALGGEAFGIVLLEAMSCATPVVASDITGYNEVVQNEENGLLCRPNDPAALATALTRLLSQPDLRVKLGAAGHKKAEALSWPRIAEQVEDYYLELLGRQEQIAGRR